MGTRAPKGALLRVLVLAGLFAAPLFAPRAMADSSILDYDGQGRLRSVRDVPAPGADAPDRTGPSTQTPARGRGTGFSSDPSAGAGPGAGAGFGAGADGSAWSDPRTWYEPGEVVAANPPQDFDIVTQAFGFRVLERTHLGSLGFEVWRLQVPKGSSVPDAISRLAQRFPGLLVDANHRYQSSEGPSDMPSQPGSQARALMGWNTADSTCGEGLRIGMVDTPVDTGHEALQGQKVVARSFIRPYREPAPAEHGTAIATMLVGRPGDRGWGGLLPKAELYAANIFAITDTGAEAADLVALVKAMDWLAEERVHVVNMSIAGADNRLLRFAIDRAAARSMVMVAAVGNWGRADPPAYPAAYQPVIGVTAIDMQNRIYPYANRGPYVAFAAPGVNIWTAVPGGGKYQSGTSFAVPYLTSLVATEIASGSTISPDLLKKLLSREAADLGAPGKDDIFGWGLVRRAPRCGESTAHAP
jgi:hypothetical protein